MITITSLWNNANINHRFELWSAARWPPHTESTWTHTLITISHSVRIQADHCDLSIQLMMTPWLSWVLISTGDRAQSAAPEQHFAFVASDEVEGYSCHPLTRVLEKKVKWKTIPEPILVLLSRGKTEKHTFRPLISNQFRRFGEFKIEMKTVFRCFAFPVVFVTVIESEWQQKMRMTKWQTWPDVTIHENIRKFLYTATLLMNARFSSRNVKMELLAGVGWLGGALEIAAADVVVPLCAPTTHSPIQCCSIYTRLTRLSAIFVSCFQLNEHLTVKQDEV